MWRISSSSASIAASAFGLSSDHNSTVMRVPMMPSVTRLTHSACAGTAARTAKLTEVINTLRFMAAIVRRKSDVASLAAFFGARPPLHDHQGAAHHTAQVGEMGDAGQGSGDTQEQLDTGVNGSEQPCRHGNRRDQRD